MNLPQILQTPKYGWSYLLVHPATRISYIDPMPNYFLNTFIESLKEKKDFDIEMDAEGYFYHIISENLENIIIETHMDDIERNYIPISYEYFIRAIINDIEIDIEDWKTFDCSLDMDEDGKLVEECVEKNKQSILANIEEIKNLLVEI